MYVSWAILIGAIFYMLLYKFYYILFYYPRRSGRKNTWPAFPKNQDSVRNFFQLKVKSSYVEEEFKWVSLKILDMTQKNEESYDRKGR